MSWVSGIWVTRTGNHKQKIGMALEFGLGNGIWVKFSLGNGNNVVPAPGFAIVGLIGR